MVLVRSFRRAVAGIVSASPWFIHFLTSAVALNAVQEITLQEKTERFEFQRHRGKVARSDGPCVLNALSKEATIDEE
jgi:hypothetical protein